jgi:hypothetical protein
MKRTLRGLAHVALAPALGGCAAPARLYVNPDADVSFYKKVAVIPLQNMTGDRYAGDRVTRAMMTELMIARPFRLVEPIEVLDRLAAKNASPDASGHVDPSKLKEALAGLDATGVIRGAVTEYEVRRTSSEELPLVSFDLEMIDLETQTVVWRVSISKRGHGHFPLLGVSGVRTLGALTQEACAEAVSRLRGKAFP